MSVTSSARYDSGQSQDDENSEKEGCTSVYVKTLTGKCVTIDTSPRDTVKKLKRLIHDKEGIPPEKQLLVSSGKQLEDDKTLLQSGVQGGSTLHLALRLRGGSQIKIKTASGRAYRVNSSDNAWEVLITAENDSAGQSTSLVISECTGDDNAFASCEFKVRRRDKQLQVTTPWGLCVSVPLVNTDTIADVITKIQAKIRPQEQAPRCPLLLDEELCQNAGPVRDILLPRLPIRVHVRTLPGTWTHEVDVSPQEKVGSLKTQISCRLKQDGRLLARDRFDLVFGGRVLHDSDMLCQQGIKNASQLILVVRCQAARRR